MLEDTRPLRLRADLHPVLRAIAARALDGSRPGARADPHRIALVIEGGAMRGVVAGGMVTALERLDLLACFDAIYGSSAGAAAAAYLMAGQAELGTRIFYEDVNGPAFIDPRRALIGRPIMDTDYLIDEVMRRISPLDWRRLIDSPITLGIVATEIDGVTSVPLTAFSREADVFDALRASTRMPLLAGGPVSIGGRRLMDGGMLQQVPFEAALAEKPTHVLALLTRPEGSVPAPPSRADRLLYKPLMDVLLSRPLGTAYLERPGKYAASLDRLARQQRRPDAAPAVYAVRLPPHHARIRRLETREAVLRRGAAAGEEAVYRAFDLAPAPPATPKSNASCRSGEGGRCERLAPASQA